MDISLVRPGEFTDALYREIADFVAARNSQPTQHIGYVGEEADALAVELRDDIEGELGFALARNGTGLVGALGVEWDADISRAFLFGPWGDGAALHDRLYAAVRPLIPAGITEKEIFCEAANTAVIDFAGRHGFTAGASPQVILRCERADLAALPPVRLPPLTPAHHAAFAELHDRAFPNTYAPAAALLRRGEPIRVAVDGDALLGYVVLRLRPEQNDAQVEYIAVDDAARGRGVGAHLLTGALHEAFADPRFTYMDLVTGNPVARRLYEKVGFRLRHDMRSFRTTAGA
jgi:ribosomal protein S18 acetylase RimI-like enzyme